MMDHGLEIKARLAHLWRSIAAGLPLMFLFFSSGSAFAQTPVPPPAGAPACIGPCSTFYQCFYSPGLPGGSGNNCVGIHRLYSPDRQKHAWATDPNEMDEWTHRETDPWQFESFYAFSTCFGSSCTPTASSPFRQLYRCYNYGLDAFQFTLVAPQYPPGNCGLPHYGYVALQPTGVFNAPLYHLTKPDVYEHLYTVSPGERWSAIHQLGYQDNGIFAYVSAPPSNDQLTIPATPVASVAYKIVHWPAVFLAEYYQVFDTSGTLRATTTYPAASVVGECETADLYVQACNGLGCSNASNVVTVLGGLPKNCDGGGGDEP